MDDTGILIAKAIPADSGADKPNNNNNNYHQWGYYYYNYLNIQC